VAEHRVGAAMVVGDGIGSIEASLDLANAGFKVYMVAPHPILAGHTPQPNEVFPTNDCEMCFMGPELVEVQRHPNIEIINQSELVDIIGTAGNFRARVRHPSEKEKSGACPGCPGCSGGNQSLEQLEEIPVGAVILAPRHKSFDPTRRPELGYGRYPNVITSMQFDRILSTSGPVAWLQCVGSRDREHNYCSSVCCLEATKKAMMAKDSCPDSEHHIFMMDMRAFGKGYMDYYNRAREEYGIRYTRCRIAAVTEDPENHDLVLKYETESGGLAEEIFKLVVLSVGMEVPEGVQSLVQNLDIALNEHGFCPTLPFTAVETTRPGIYVCGSLSQPKDTHDTVTQAAAAASRTAELLAQARGALVQPKTYPPEHDVSPEESRIGVFFSRCGLEQSLDIPTLVEYTRSLPNVVYAGYDGDSRFANTQAHIRTKIEELSLNRVVVASGTPHIYERLYQEVLREAGLNPYLIEIANLREQCAWVHPTEWEAATAKAKDLVRMAVARACLLEPLHTVELDVVQKALIIGGGVAGMNAALSLARQGFDVYLIEREKDLGGNLRYIYYDLDGKDVQTYLRDLIAIVEANPHIKVLKETTLLETSGSIGNFASVVCTRDGQQILRHGATIVATGGEEYRGRDYMLGQDPRILTQRDLEERIVHQNPSVLAAREIVMIQCVGPAKQYCSRICCSSALKNALKIKEINPKANIYILYKDIRAYGFREQYYTEAREKGVIFIR